MGAHGSIALVNSAACRGNTNQPPQCSYLCLAAENAGVEGEVIVQKLLGQSFEVGYNAMYDRIENLIEVRWSWAGRGVHLLLMFCICC